MKSLYLKKIIALILLPIFGLVGCATSGVFLKETPLSASDTRKAIVTVIGDPRSTSDNGRELVSRFQNKSGEFDDNLKSAKERRFTLITILGDRRPYDIQVEVFIEKKGPEGQYEVMDHDLSLEEEMASRIKRALHQSLENRNMIDDFRAF